MPNTRIANKKAFRKAEENAVEEGVTSAQRVFAKILEKTDLEAPKCASI